MIRSILVAAAALAATAAWAQSPVATGHGATAGRSPHQAYAHKSDVAATCAPRMHSQPAGKLPSYGTFHHADPSCEQQQRIVASADKAERAQRD